MSIFPRLVDEVASFFFISPTQKSPQNKVNATKHQLNHDDVLLQNRLEIIEVLFVIMNSIATRLLHVKTVETSAHSFSFDHRVQTISDANRLAVIRLLRAFVLLPQIALQGEKQI
jgi:hypothetical protein